MEIRKGVIMAKFGKKTGKEVEKAIHEKKRTLKSGKSGRKGAKLPKKKAAKSTRKFSSKNSS